MGLESGWYDYVWLQKTAPAASSILWTEPNKINDLAGRQIKHLAHAAKA